MIKTLTKHGNSWALIIDKPVLDLLKIEPDTPLEISTDGHTLVVSPARASDHKERVRAARKKVNAKYSKAFRKLAE